jgi:hypothetical protein
VVPGSSMLWPGISAALSAGGLNSRRWARRSAVARVGSCSPGPRAMAGWSISGPRITRRRLPAGGRFWRSTCTSIPTTSTSALRPPPMSTLSCRRSAGRLLTGSTGSSKRRPEPAIVDAANPSGLPRVGWSAWGSIDGESSALGTIARCIGSHKRLGPRTASTSAVVGRSSHALTALEGEQGEHR